MANENNYTVPSEPLTREEEYLDAIVTNTSGGGGSSKYVVDELNVTTNGTYTGTGGVNAYNPVNVNVANSYTAEDEGKVVNSGELVAQTSTTITSNSTVDTTTNNSVTVNVANSYTAEDEGKVVNSGELVAQTSRTVTTPGTFDTTLNNSFTVDIDIPVVEKDVNFYDYEGTLLYSYTTQEFLALTEMPANPTHEGLTAQGWNWSFSDATTYVTTYGKLNVGQMYVTSDGKTRLYITLNEGRLKPYLGLTGNSNGTAASIDWGDNSTAESVTLNTSTVYTPHEYASAGDYVIAITVTNGSISFKGDNSKGSNILRNSQTPNSLVDRVYANSLIKLHIGNNVTSIYDYAFNNCCSLTSIMIPNSVINIYNEAFIRLNSLTSITIPNSITTIENYTFTECYALTSITIPNSVTSVGHSAIYYCKTLTSITIPNSVTSVGNNAFGYNDCLKTLIIPNSVTSMGDYTCSSNISITSITIPNSITSLGNSTFNGCRSLISVTIPNSVTSISNGAMMNCLGLGFIKFEGSTPPTVSNSDAWANIPTDCIIYVPTGSLSAYTSASNYPSSSTYTYVEY